MAIPIDQSSPQSVAEGFRTALSESAWKRALAYMVPELRANLIAGLFFGGAYAADSDRVASQKLVDMMDKHGLHRDEKLDPATADLPAILRDVVKWSDRYLSDAHKLNLDGDALQTEYPDFRIDGDAAYAIKTCKGSKSESRFKRIDGLWYLV